MRPFPLLLLPGILSLKNSLDARKIFGRLPFTMLGVALWLFIYIVFSKILVYFMSVEVFGDILSAKLLSMVLLTFLSFLIMSNIITALSVFYLSKDIELLLSRPVDMKKIQSAKTVATFTASSWMVISFALPVLLAYGNVYKAGYLYYLWLPFIFIPFFLIPTGAGVIITHFIAKTFPARNARDVIMLLGVIFIFALFVLFRLLQPEKFLAPERFPTLLEYLASMGSDSFFMPHYWATQALLPLLRGGQGDGVFFTLVLISNAAFSLLAASWCGRLLYGDALNKAFSSKRRGFRFPLERIFADRPAKLRTALMVKDMKIFLRDNSQWPQLLLLLALVIIYVYNFKVLPLSAIPEAAFIISNFIAFFNLILAGFVLSAIAARFLYPAVSLEGEAFWVICASPLSMKDFLYGKLISSLTPLLTLSVILVAVTNIILGIKGFMMIISLATILLMTVAIGGLGIGLGAVYPKFKYDNIASIPMGFGGIFFMILALSAITLTVVLEAWPLYLYLTGRITGRAFGSREATHAIISFSMVIVINALAFYIPLRLGEKSLESEKWT